MINISIAPTNLEENNEGIDGGDSWTSESESDLGNEKEDRVKRSRRELSSRTNKTKRKLGVLCERDINISPVPKKIRHLEEQIKRLSRQRRRQGR